MLYYLGKGTEFKKEECKEYKTLKNALVAAAKDEALTVSSSFPPFSSASGTFPVISATVAASTVPAGFPFSS
mgnify:CR=1 FL=1